jgi:hypothetical protein
MKKFHLILTTLLISANTFASEGTSGMENYSIGAGIGFFVIVLIFFAFFLYRSARHENYSPKTVIKYSAPEQASFEIFLTPAFRFVYYTVIFLVFIHALTFSLYIL